MSPAPSLMARPWSYRRPRSPSMPQPLLEPEPPARPHTRTHRCFPKERSASPPSNRSPVGPTSPARSNLRSRPTPTPTRRSRTAASWRISTSPRPSPALSRSTIPTTSPSKSASSAAAASARKQSVSGRSPSRPTLRSISLGFRSARRVLSSKPRRFRSLPPTHLQAA